MGSSSLVAEDDAGGGAAAAAAAAGGGDNVGGGGTENAGITEKGMMELVDVLHPQRCVCVMMFVCWWTVRSAPAEVCVMMCVCVCVGGQYGLHPQRCVS